MKLLIITSLYSVYYMYMYCSYFIIQKRGFLHQAARFNKVTILEMMLRHGANIDLQDRVSDYILFVIRM